MSADNNAPDLKSLADKMDRLLLAINNSNEFKHIKTQYATLNVVVNRLQSQQLETGASSSTKGEDADQKPNTGSGDAIPFAVQHVHKLVFPKYDG